LRNRNVEKSQGEFWIDRRRIAPARTKGFYGKLNQTLEEMNFAQKVWAVCTPSYQDASRGGRPGIDPVVYFKMLMVGFFENLLSERAIAARCEDLLTIREFLGYGLEERTPEHSSLTVIRQRLGEAVFQEIFLIVLQALRGHGLLKGRHLGIDSSGIEANASLRSLEHRNTEESYWQYVKTLAAQDGIDVQDDAAVRRYDKTRPGRTTSNKEWKNPHDEDARIGKTKDGACDMIYKPETVTDLETGAIVAVEVLPGDQADTEGLGERVGEAVVVVHSVCGSEENPAQVQSLTADKGYFAAGQIATLQEWGLHTVGADRQAARRKKENYPKEEWKAIQAARRSVRSAWGKALLRKRGMHLERPFEHILDEGGLRKATLRGRQNLTKRFRLAAACFNLSLLLRTLHGIGTPKQWAIAAFCAWLCSITTRFVRIGLSQLVVKPTGLDGFGFFPILSPEFCFPQKWKKPCFSTVC
jgi:transposase